MAKETIQEIKTRHKKEWEELQKNCKHESNRVVDRFDDSDEYVYSVKICNNCEKEIKD